jgi:tetratricopeptide (TPR) repeat protein
MEAQEATPEANCFAVDVFYGDTRVSPNSVSVSPERTSNGELRIRIRTSTIVDEPVVTLFLRVSCNAAVSRRYVLLAEALSDAESGSAQPLSISPAITAPAPSLSAAPRTAFGGALPAASAAPVTSAADRKAERGAQRQARREARRENLQSDPQAAAAQPQQRDLPVARAALVAPRPSVVRRPLKAGAPRLQVDLLDLTSTELSLRGSVELSSAPSGDAAVRAQAQALWRSLNASPEEAMRDTQRLGALETQMRTALEQSKRQGQDIATLSTELQAAQRARYVNPFTIFLGVLTLAAIAASLLLWRRSKGQGQPWWGNRAEQAVQKDEQHLWTHLGDGTDSVLPQNQASKTSGFQAGATASRAAPPRASSPDEFTRPGVLAEKGSQGPLRFVEKPVDPIDFKPPADKISLATAKIQPLGSSAPSGRGGSMGRVDSTPPPSLGASIGRGGRSGFGNTDFAASTFGGGGRVVAAEELFDIQEQADFFMSLDQPDQAIEVLKNHITENVETSALAYMDLFDIYHRTNRLADYTELREEFNRVFNAQVPVFSQYGAPSNGLEDVPDVLSSIQACWSRPQQAQDVIEESIFRQPGQDQHPLDMAAYRELMLLYALAKELGRPGAKFSMLPASMQSVALPSLSGAVSNMPDLDLDDALDLAGPQIDMLSLDPDATISLSHGLLPSDEAAKKPAFSDDGLDFDLSESPQIEFKLPGAAKKS